MFHITIDPHRGEKVRWPVWIRDVELDERTFALTVEFSLGGTATFIRARRKAS